MHMYMYIVACCPSVVGQPDVKISKPVPSDTTSVRQSTQLVSIQIDCAYLPL